MNEHVNRLRPEILLWGGTGQAKVVRPIIEHWGASVVAVFDDTPDLSPPFPDVPLYCGWAGFQRWISDQDRTQMGFCIAIGNPHGSVRLRLAKHLEAEGLAPTTIVHPAAWVAANAQIGVGCQILAGAIVGAEARLGRQCIINTKASVDHECILADGVEIAPGATLCGLVEIGATATVYAGATIAPRIRIGERAVVRAGAVVVRNVAEGAVVAGVPARPIAASSAH